MTDLIASERLDAPKLTRGGQSLDYAALWTVGSTPRRRARVIIKRDSYDGQSYARIDLWDGDKWNHVTSLPRSYMAVLSLKQGPRGHDIPAVSYAGRRDLEEVRAFFEQDERSLLVELELVLG